mmetsp:Transcript_21659/g.65758  ORF Transcript_21659/g.65758 Transcript_21659/m.65758 type:complete len:229 (-) Transcript_21659:229-915(-)
MVPLVARELLPSLKVVLVDPEVAAARDKRLAVRVERGGVDAVPIGLNHVEREALEALPGGEVPKGYLGAGGHRHHRPIGRELDRVDVAAEPNLPNGVCAPQVPYPHRLVLARGEHRVLVSDVPHDLDACRVPVQQPGLGGCAAHQVEEPECLLLAARHKRARVRRPVGTPYNVLVRQRVQLVARERVPDLCREVSGARDRMRGWRIERRAPHGALVPLKGPNPVSRVP